MAKTKQLDVTEINEQVKGLPFQDQILHFQNVKSLLEDAEKAAMDEKMQAEDRLLAIKNINNGK